MEPLYGFIMLIVGAAMIYMLPTFIAVNRKHRNTTSICLLNLLLGWTFIGWVVALVWSTAHRATT